jgi:hypothetical protein
MTTRGSCARMTMRGAGMVGGRPTLRKEREGWGTRQGQKQIPPLRCGMTTKNRQQRNAGVPPLRRQSTPPPVGMTESRPCAIVAAGGCGLAYALWHLQESHASE